QRITARVFRSDILIFHFDANFQAFVRQKNRRHRSLRETPFAPAVASIFFFKEPVHCPFDASEELLGKKQPDFVRVGDLGRTALFFLSSARRRWNFFVSNRADTEFVFGENCRVERNLVPISKGPPRFETHASRSAAAIKSLELRFGRYVETPG